MSAPRAGSGAQAAQRCTRTGSADARKAAGTAKMTHLLGWLVLGAALALTTWLAAPQRHFAALMAMIPTGASAAVISGLAFWMLWDFPGEVVSPNDWLSTP